MSKFSFDLYCAVLPGGWGVTNMTANYKAPGLLAEYKNGAGSRLDLWEGEVCTIEWNACSGFFAPDLGAQAFGPLTGDMAGSDGTWELVVDTSNPSVRYRLVGENMTEAAFRSISAKVHKIG
jgi:hypothetical protein